MSSPAAQLNIDARAVGHADGAADKGRDHDSGDGELPVRAGLHSKGLRDEGEDEKDGEEEARRHVFWMVIFCDLIKF